MSRFPPIEPYATGMLGVGDGQQVYWETCGDPAGEPALVHPAREPLGIDQRRAAAHKFPTSRSRCSAKRARASATRSGRKARGHRPS